MRQIMLISYCIILFLLTTFILVYFLLFMDLYSDQKMMIGLFSFLGYSASSLTFYVWNDERKSKDILS
jgi:hypothetical protein